MDLLAVALFVLLAFWAILALANPRGLPPWGPTAVLAAFLTCATVRLAGWA